MSSIDILKDSIQTDYRDNCEALETDFDCLMDDVEGVEKELKGLVDALELANKKLVHLEAQIVAGIYNTLIPDEILKESKSKENKLENNNMKLTNENVALKENIDWMGKRITKLEGDAAEQRLSAMMMAH